MADETVLAESSPAETTSAAEVVTEAISEPKPIKDLKEYTPEETQKWLNTGKIAEEQVEQEESAPQKSESEKGKSAPASDTGTKASKQKTAETTEQRKERVRQEISDLLKERKEAREELERLKREKQELTSPKTEEKPAPSTEAKKDAPKKPVRPKLQDFVDKNLPFEDYQAARDKYEDDLETYLEAIADDKAEAKFKSFKEQSEQERQQETRKQKWERSIDQAKKDRPDYELVALNPELQLSAPMLEFLEDSDLRGELLYALGEDLEKARQIAALNPVKAARELVRLENALSSGSEESALEPKPKAVVSKAPPPARNLHGTASPGDPSIAAVKADDFRAYELAENAKQTARKQRGF